MRMSAKLKRMFGTTQVQPAFQLSSRVRTTPSQIQWSGTVRVLCKAQKEEEYRSRQAAENAPPKVVFHEEVAEVVNRDQDDRGGFQPVGVVNGVRCASRTRGAVRFCAQSLCLWSGNSGFLRCSVRNELSGAAELRSTPP